MGVADASNAAAGATDESDEEADAGTVVHASDAKDSWEICDHITCKGDMSNSNGKAVTTQDFAKFIHLIKVSARTSRL